MKPVDHASSQGSLEAMRYLVTGAAGFIGSHYVRRLLGEGGPLASRDYSPTHVTVLDALTYAGNRANLASVEGEFEFVHGDICDADLLARIVPGHDVVINFAAESHVDRSIHGPSGFVRTNVLGAHAVFEAARQAGVRRLVQIGTDEVYGSIDEGAWTEDSPLLPNSPYSAAKAAAELLVRAYHTTYGMDVISTRCSNNYGPYQFPEKIIPLFTTRIVDGRRVPLYGDGLNRRDWLHVDDHVRGIHIALEQGEAGLSYNIGGGRELNNIELTERILETMGVSWDVVDRVDDRLGHDRRYCVDDSRLRALGYAPQQIFESGLASTIEWYRSNESWWRPLLERM